jgi:CheY-like chemotaxis protein
VAVFGCRGDSIRDGNDEELEPSTGEMIPYARTPANAFRLKPDTTADTEPEDRLSSLGRGIDSVSSAAVSQTARNLLIYAVDDAPELTELYTILLEATGYIVRAFNDRAKALTALKAERTEPNLLITDCVGTSMCVDRFMECCLLIHPNLRILMASGYSRADVPFFQARPDWFIEKPFTVEEFLKRVRVAVAA